MQEVCLFLALYYVTQSARTEKTFLSGAPKSGVLQSTLTTPTIHTHNDTPE